MNILFLTPYITDFTAYDLWLRPLGLMQVAAAVKSWTNCRVFWLNPLDRYAGSGCDPGSNDGRGHFHRTVIAKPECFKPVPRHYARYGWPLDVFASRLQTLPPMDLICMTTLMTYWVDGAVFTLEAVRRHSPRAVTAVGGILPTLMPAASRREIGADHHICGPGENLVLELIQHIGGRNLFKPRPSPVSHEEFLSPADPAYPLLTSRGCPMQCSYCASRLLNPEFSQRSVNEIVGEICIASRSRRHFVFFDDALLIDKEKRFIPVTRAISGMNLRLHTPNGLHVREINAVTARALYEAGTLTLRLSLETTATDIHDRGGGKADSDTMRRAVNHLLEAGFSPDNLETYVLWGLPGQSIESVHATLDFVENLGIIPRMADYSPVPGTPDCRRLQSSGRLGRPLDPRHTNKLFHLLQTTGYSSSDIETVRARCHDIVHKVQNCHSY